MPETFFCQNCRTHVVGEPIIRGGKRRYKRCRTCDERAAAAATAAPDRRRRRYKWNQHRYSSGVIAPFMER